MTNVQKKFLTVVEDVANRGYPCHLITVLKNLYHGISVIIDVGDQFSDKITVSQGLRQGCSLSPTLFNIHLDDMTWTWQEVVIEGVDLCEVRSVNSLFCG